MVRKEIWAFLLAYNLLRSLMWWSCAAGGFPSVGDCWTRRVGWQQLWGITFEVIITGNEATFP